MSARTTARIPVQETGSHTTRADATLRRRPTRGRVAANAAAPSAPGGRPALDRRHAPGEARRRDPTTETAATAGTGSTPAAGPRAAPLLLHVFPSFGIGGVQLRMATVANHLGSRYRHIFVALDGVTDSQGQLSPGLDAVVLAPAIDKRRPVATLRQIRRLLAETPHDLLLTHNWGAVEWALVNRFFGSAPNIHFESGFGHDDPDGRLTRRVLARRFAFAGIERLVVPSRSLCDLAAGLWKLDRRRIVHIPNGVDVVRFGRPPDPGAIPGFAPAPDELVIGTVAPLRPIKNIGRLLRAFGRLAQPRARLVIVGDGSELAALKTLAAGLGVAGRVVFAGHLDAPETVYGLFDIFVMSSDSEQMPNTLLQAMAAGRPVAATDVGDIRAIVAAENRPYVVPRDDAALADAIRRLAVAPDLRTRLGAANRQRACSTYALDTMCAAYRELFDACLGSRPPP
jgi:glycosyltransferase involved in cell wall biosynthesis